MSWTLYKQLRLALGGRSWRDERNDSLNLKSSGVGVSVNYTEGVVEFIHTASLTDFLIANIQLNHDRDETSVISPHLHWFAAEEAVVPNFLLSYRWQVLGATKTTGWTDVAFNTAVLPAPAAGVTKHQICECVDIEPPEGSTISDIVQFKICRDHGNASGKFDGDDPYTATVGVLAFDVHVQINALGSTSEYSK